ncbi:MAG: hypothetical protein HWN81_09905 [Candidatus Lokiarchaeota archaeon]|nr:hypothetical protein [Candidatus Lokiarchaeota archaeon]
MSEQKLKRKPQELILAKQLIDGYKFDEADQLIRSFEEKGGHTLHDNVLCHLLKCELLYYRGLQQGQYEDVVKLAEQTYKESLGLGNNLLSVDILLIMAHALLFSQKLDEAVNIIRQGEELLKSLSQELPADYKHREAHLAFIKGWYYMQIMNADRALKHSEHSLALLEELDVKQEIDFSLSVFSLSVYSLNTITRVYIYLKGDYDRALIYNEKALTNAEESGNKWLIGWMNMGMGVIYGFKGEIDRSIKYYEQSLTIYNEINFKTPACFTIAYLIQTLIDKGELERTQQLLHQLEQLNNQQKSKLVNLYYLLNKALLLKTSPRARNRSKAEEILKQILKDEDSDFELILKALTNLCELLLTELRMTNDLEVLEEINPLIARLLDTAEKSYSYSILCETYLLQAKLSLLTFKIKKAKRFLTQAQQIAERFGLNLLARKISNEHDKLLKQLSMWENLKESKASLNERMELARLNEQMENMTRKRAIEVPELSDEDPVLLLVVSEGGRPIFSQSFVEDQAFEDHLFGGFFTAINSFISEKFSEGLDRAIFGEHTLLMNSVSPFLICYVYKGQSYSAQQRVKYFIDKIQNDEPVWQTFNKFNQVNREIQLKDIPSLEPLINEIFIRKTIHLNGLV